MEIRILGRVYKIQVSQLPEGEHGVLEPLPGLIKVAPSTDKESTLLHEVLHAILYESGLTNMLSAEVEEAIVCGLENGLMRSDIIRQDIANEFFTHE